MPPIPIFGIKTPAVHAERPPFIINQSHAHWTTPRMHYSDSNHSRSPPCKRTILEPVWPVFAAPLFGPFHPINLSVSPTANTRRRFVLPETSSRGSHHRNGLLVLTTVTILARPSLRITPEQSIIPQYQSMIHRTRCRDRCFSSIPPWLTLLYRYVEEVLKM
jgi:hypothetical protein